MFPDRFVSRTRRRAAEVRLAAAVQGRNPRALAAGLVVIGYLVLIAAPLASDILASGLPGPGMPGGPATRPRAASSAAPPAAAGGAAQPSGVPAVDQYLRGVSDLDAGLMWGALAAGEIKSREDRGGWLEALQGELDEVKQRGIGYEGVRRVAGYPARGGGR